MSQFTLDYTSQRPAYLRPKRSLFARLFILFVIWAAISPVLVMGLTVGLFHYHNRYQGISQQHRTLLVQHDSLFAAKQETDRRLVGLLRKYGKPLQTQSDTTGTNRQTAEHP